METLLGTYGFQGFVIFIKLLLLKKLEMGSDSIIVYVPFLKLIRVSSKIKLMKFSLDLDVFFKPETTSKALYQGGGVVKYLV